MTSSAPDADENRVRHYLLSLRGEPGTGTADTAAVDTPDETPDKQDEPKGEIAEAFTAAVPNRRLRWLAYNGTAAALGHAALWGITGNFMAGPDALAVGTISLVPLGVAAVTAGAAYAGWRAGGALQTILRGLPVAAMDRARPAAAFAGAFWAQGTGPFLSEALTQVHPWPQFFAPLIIAGGAAVACWALLDRRTTGWHPVLRWAARIPLATIVLSSALYAPGALL
ncbi:hypothetical protein [Streptomyces jumonjinensis]|uniref:Uncharacterized protein n=1 Tax=Streptomyces jumonjinensis TaxID=1945 RepID=A0A646KLG7_STRJU|nr:hypothetical protein [Streptomyces jumonjinensis]MQT03152.1 hypothetical protein [Streptomyces jumonjinensis]